MMEKFYYKSHLIKFIRKSFVGKITNDHMIFLIKELIHVKNRLG